MRALFIIIGIVLVGYVSYRTYRILTLDEGLEAAIAKGATILDVRTEKEYKTGHINGSINISLGTIRERFIELDSNKTYITVCSHGLRSVKAAALLKEKGFQKVYNGGAWPDLEKMISSRPEK